MQFLLSEVFCCGEMIYGAVDASEEVNAQTGGMDLDHPHFLTSSAMQSERNLLNSSTVTWDRAGSQTAQIFPV